MRFRRARRAAVAPASTPGRFGLGAVFSAVFALFGWAVGISSLSDNSFFWHLRTGEYILDHGIPHHDVFSFTAAGTSWVAQSWLAEVTYGVLYRSFGAFGVRFFVGVVGAGIGLLAYRLALRLVRDRVVACGITLAALAGIYTLWSERPLLIGVLFFLVLLWVVEVPDSFVGRHPIIVLAGAVLAVGERARQLRARVRVSWHCTCSVAGSTATGRGTGANGCCSLARRSASP